jgi:hypothetical protein
LSCLILFARAFSSLSSSRCLWYWMSSYPSSRPLLPLISFEALQSSAVFCHSRHTSNFLICVGYHQNNISISKTNYPRHIPISKNLLDHTMIYQWQKVIVIVPAAITPEFYFYFFNPDYVRQPKGILDSNQGEYVCHHLRATIPSAFLDKKPSGTPCASLSRWTSSSFISPLKRVPPLNCHVEISNGLSVPLSWNSWSRNSRNLLCGAHPLTKCSAPFWALLFSSLLESCSMFSSSIN